MKQRRKVKLNRIYNINYKMEVKLRSLGLTTFIKTLINTHNPLAQQLEGIVTIEASISDKLSTAIYNKRYSILGTKQQTSQP